MRLVRKFIVTWTIYKCFFLPCPGKSNTLIGLSREYEMGKYHCTIDPLFGSEFADNFCFYLQNKIIQTSQTGGQQYSDTCSSSIPWFKVQSLDKNKANKLKFTRLVFPQRHVSQVLKA